MILNKSGDSCDLRYQKIFGFYCVERHKVDKYSRRVGSGWVLWVWWVCGWWVRGIDWELCHVFLLTTNPQLSFVMHLTFPFCMRLISSSIGQISFWYSKLKIPKSTNGWWWGRGRKHTTFDGFINIDIFINVDIFINIDISIKIDIFINFNWYFSQFDILLKLIFLSIIDKNINTWPSLFP